MNKIYNSWIFIISFFTLLFAFVVNLYSTYGVFANLGFLEEDPIYKKYVFTISAVLLFLIGARRSYKKWVGLKVVNQISRFQFNTFISQEQRKKVILISSLEIIAFSLIGIAFIVFSNDANLITLVFLIFIIDSIVNSANGILRKKYRIGMTNKAIVCTDREVRVIYFKGLKRVSLQNGELFFEYVNNLVLDINLNMIPVEKQEEFIFLLRKTVDETKVYFSGFKK